MFGQGDEPQALRRRHRFDKNKSAAQQLQVWILMDNDGQTESHQFSSS